LNTTLTPHSIIHGDACFAYFNKIWGIPPKNWQWIGPHMSQRMFGITEARARAYAERHGGTATKMD
jgi:hypothetical protein